MEEAESTAVALDAFTFYCMGDEGTSHASSRDGGSCGPCGPMNGSDQGCIVEGQVHDWSATPELPARV